MARRARNSTPRSLLVLGTVWCQTFSTDKSLDKKGTGTYSSSDPCWTLRLPADLYTFAFYHRALCLTRHCCRAVASPAYEVSHLYRIAGTRARAVCLASPIMAIKYKLPNNLLNRIVGCPAQTVPSDSVAAAQARKEARDQYRAVLHNLEKCGLVDKHVRVNWERSVARVSDRQTSCSYNSSAVATTDSLYGSAPFLLLLLPPPLPALPVTARRAQTSSG